MLRPVSPRPPDPERYLIRLGQAVLQAREELGLSQEELGFESELDRTYISGIERGVRNPTVKSLLRIAHALRTTPGALLTTAGRSRR